MKKALCQYGFAFKLPVAVLSYSFSICLDADKQVFPKLDIVGWYATGEEVQETDMLIHRKASLPA